MAAKKSTSKKGKNTSSSKGKAPAGKKQSAPPKKGGSARTAAEKQKVAVIMMAAALIMLALTLIKGESVWAAVHNFIFGLFGICSFIWPLMLIYIAVMIAKDSPKATVNTNLVGSGCFMLFLSGIIHIFAGNIC